MTDESIALVVEYDAVVVDDCEDLVGIVFRSVPLVETNNTQSANPQSADSPTYLIFKSQLMDLKALLETALSDLEAQAELRPPH